MASTTTLPKLSRSEDPLKDKTNLPDKQPAIKVALPTDSNPRILPSPPMTENAITSTTDSVDTSGSSSDYNTAVRSNRAAYNSNITLSALSEALHSTKPIPTATLAEGLHIETNLPSTHLPLSPHSLESDSSLRGSTSASSLPRRLPSIRAALHSSVGSLSPSSVLSSPQLTALLDISPLPSPTHASRDTFKLEIPSRSRGSSLASKADLSPVAPQLGTVQLASPPRRKAYPGIQVSATDGLQSVANIVKNEDAESRSRTRSLSEYVPGAVTAPKPRQIAVSGSGAPVETIAAQTSMHREEYLAVQRGFTNPIARPPTPPRSNTGGYTSGEDVDEPSSKRVKTEIYTAQSIVHGHQRRYKAIRFLGQGTFSKVFLAVRQVDSGDDGVDYSRDSTNMAGVRLRSRRLVAVKVVEHGPAGGADEERIEVSLQREVEIMKSVMHPSLVHLKAFGTGDDQKALLVMNYCPGGDLFEVASTKLEVLVPSLVRRIFSELVSAVRYLHQKFVVHRDIKLENVLLNIPVQVHSDVPDWQTIDRAVVTLTDLGLSRRIPEPPESPLLTTRCGSEDYAAPELLMGQEYDGRQTDAWALGVLLYALMEGRLPFDPLPGARGDPAKLRARTPHRIARCEWAWYKFVDDDGEWDPTKGKGFEGARIIVEGLLKRTSRRISLDAIREMEWVKDGIKLDGGLRWVDEESP